MINLELIRNAIRNPSFYGVTLSFVGAVGIFIYSGYTSSNLWKENEVGENFVTIQLAAFAPPSKDKVAEKIQKPKPLVKKREVHKKQIQAPPKPVISELQAIEKPQEEVKEVSKEQEVIKEEVQEASEATTIKSSPDAFAQENIKIMRFSEGMDNEFLRAIRLAIQRRHEYPHLARQRGYEGRIIVKFLLDMKGKVSKIEVVKASKHDILNKAAVKAVKRACRDFPRPDEITFIEIPIVYELNAMQ